MRFTTKILPSRSKGLGVILLNNSKSLHALNIDMINCLQDVFQQWKVDPSLNAILIKSSSEETKRPSFCAGGDMKSIYNQGLQYHQQQQQQQQGKQQPTSSSSSAAAAAALPPPEDFFYHEYKVNYDIANFNKFVPIVSLWDGLVMGGGVGISIYGKYRIATENTILSMPECGIGFFPDVGSMWWMTRMLKERPELAKYLALTGYRMEPADLVYTSLATHYIPSNQLEDLEAALAEATTIPTDHCNLKINKETIENTFNGETVEEIFNNLKKEDNEFSRSTIKTLEKMSPTSMKITLEGLKRGAECKSMAEDLQMEYRMAKACVRPGRDFYEGIRALLVDKDLSPKWNPSTLEEVTDDMIEEYFSPIDKEWSNRHQKTEPSKL
ncbi:enoyl-CoA hydratase [Fragilariopsis cylindrus CCMP1102]|uniref:3-hydroxyisobutyryl-CoA hydrolase n=1 Tax=Fragilariopsis cylindrus CCMP1102 TaxID=635003 RepID=A0A1E7FWG5_9STRA|nr:enoyl-CoA hydratase [Fragilariopsis cylindrus CCMP1102]|eukprot:OEU22477.1 enoyl-CoA hydratase [Fragilariopsis cylindrus CCMP1102]